MTVTVLIVDDSSFFRRRIVEILSPMSEVKVVGTATNGREAVEKNNELKPDVITMDYEMPMMDGITAVQHIMRERPTAILMFSSLTFEGARVTLDALSAGALDFLPKSFEAISPDSKDIGKLLTDKILAIVKKKDRSENLAKRDGGVLKAKDFIASREATSDREPARFRDSSYRQPENQSVTKTSVRSGHVSHAQPTVGSKPSLLLIGASTGGPVALQNILKELPANFPAPILIIQHMPETFTKAFADRLNRYCQISVREAEDHEPLRAGQGLVAPGGKQMLVSNNNGTPCVRILESDERLQYKPSVDVTFGSAAKVFHGKVLALVLTGMGADGREGAKLLKRENSRIWTQDEASCVVYGMPFAVKKAQLSDEEVKIEDMGRRIRAEFRCGST